MPARPLCLEIASRRLSHPSTTLSAVDIQRSKVEPAKTSTSNIATVRTTQTAKAGEDESLQLLDSELRLQIPEKLSYN